MILDSAAPPPVIQMTAPYTGAQSTSPPISPVVSKHVRHAPGDPFETFNRRMFGIQQSLDRAILRPAAMGYQHIVPKFIRLGLRHFFSNLGEPVIFANFVLQGKPKSAARTAVRFLINSTIGVGGTIDVAKSKAVELPHRPNGLGDTLGFYGVKPGPYIFLPLVGPSDLRDFLGNQADGAFLPVVVGKPFYELQYQIPKAVLTGLDERAEADADFRALLAEALDPYATLRSVYLQDRAGEIANLKGKPVSDDFDTPQDPAAPDIKPAAPSAAPELQDPLADPAAPAPDPAPKPSAPSSGADPAAPVQR